MNKSSYYGGIDVSKPYLDLHLLPSKQAKRFSNDAGGYGNGDYKAFADCFDPAGLKQMNITSIQMLTVFANLARRGRWKKRQGIAREIQFNRLCRSTATRPTINSPSGLRGRSKIPAAS